jgi:putative ABC transport system permease protein
VGEIFDQTFAITGVLRLIAIVVAVCGVLLSLGILVQERSREIAVLRALGASRGQVLRTVLSEAGLLGALASLVGMASGAGLALVLTYVINKAFFGWTVDLAYPWDFLAWTPVWVLATALLAALWPAWRATMIQPAEALRVE